MIVVLQITLFIVVRDTAPFDHGSAPKISCRYLWTYPGYQTQYYGVVYEPIFFAFLHQSEESVKEISFCWTESAGHYRNVKAFFKLKFLSINVEYQAFK